MHGTSGSRIAKGFQAGEKIVFNSGTGMIRAYGSNRNTLTFFDEKNSLGAKYIKVGFVNSVESFKEFCEAIAKICGRSLDPKGVIEDTERKEFSVLFR